MEIKCVFVNLTLSGKGEQLPFKGLEPPVMLMFFFSPYNNGYLNIDKNSIIKTLNVFDIVLGPTEA